MKAHPGKVLRIFIHSRRIRRVVLFVVTGAVAGLLAVAYSALLDILTHYAQGGLLGRVEHPGQVLAQLKRPWILPVMTTLVGGLTGFLISRLAPEAACLGSGPGPALELGDAGGRVAASRTAQGEDTSWRAAFRRLISGTGLASCPIRPVLGKGVTDGTDAMIRAFHQGQGRIKPLTAFLRTSTSILTLASGGSAGKEGPVAFMGAGFGSWLAEKINLSDQERRSLLLAGAAGGLGAIFRSPLGAAMTAVEVLYSEDFEGEALLSAIVSSVSAYMVYTLFYGTAPYVRIPDLRPASIQEVPFYLLLAAACAGSAWLYVKGFFFIKYKMFGRFSGRIGLPMTTALGGLTMGMVGMLYPNLIGASHASLEMTVLGQVPALAILMLLLGKILATSVTIGSGFSGGMFAPGLFVGGMTGGLVGKLCHAWRPEFSACQGAFVMVGMSAFFACAAKAPIGPMIMVCEITRGYVLLAPLMLCTAVALLISGDFCLYENQLRGKWNSPAHRGESAEAALRQLQVSDVYTRGRMVVLEEGTTLGALSDIISGTSALAFPVRSHEGHITGLVTIGDVRQVIFENVLYPLLVVRDLARQPVLLRPGQDLHQALLAFVEAKADELPVVDPTNPDKVVGSLTMHALLAAHRES
jgi:CIC family chloride channel protein